MSDLTNRQVVLRRRPTGLVQPDDTELVERPAPTLAEGEALVRNTYIGIDAAVRTWLDDQPGYLPPVQLGDPIRAAGVAEVIESRCDAYAVGDVVTTLSVMPKYAVAPVEPYTDSIASWSTTPGITVVNRSSRTTWYSCMSDSVVTTSPTA